MRSYFLALVLLFLTINQVVAQVDISGNPATTSVNINDVFTIDIEVIAGTTDLNAAEVHLDFDPAILEIQSFTAGTTLPTQVISNPSLPAAVFDNTNGTIDYSAGITGSTVNGTFTLLSIEVKALAAASPSILNFRTAPAEFPRRTEVSEPLGTSVFGTATDIDITVINPNPPFQLCIASGSAGLTALGRTFEADNPTSNASNDPHPSRSGGTKYGGYSGAIAGTTSGSPEETLFQKEIFGGKNNANIVNYNVPVTNGLYAVDLYFSEVFHSAPNGRVFDVFLEGNLILDEYDLVDPEKDGLSSNQTAITRTYYVSVTDGSLDVVVGPATVDNGKIAGLCITEVSSANLMPTTNIGNVNTEALLAAAINLNISDPENDNLSVTLFGLPASLSYNSSNGQIEGTPAANEVGAYTINAIISDGTSAAITEEFTLTVDPSVANTPPTITPIADVNVAPGSNINIPITVTDDNNPSATIVIYDKSAGGAAGTPNPSTTISSYTFSGSPGSYTLDWTPVMADARSYLAVVTADDGALTATETFSINVAQAIPATITANTFANPLPWYGSNPVSPYTVSIEAAGNIGWIENGEFVEYLIDVPTPGSYDVTFTSSNGSGQNGSSTDISLLEDGNPTPIGTITVPKAGWTNFQDFTTTVIFANTGLQTLRLEFDGGVNTQQFVFVPTPVGNTAPVVTIALPTDGAYFIAGNSASFAGSSVDAEEGNLGSGLSWSSDIDGVIGTGLSFATSSLSPGTHTITASSTDTDPTNPLTGTASIIVIVNNPAPSCNVSFRVNAGGALYADPSGDFEEDQTAASPGGSAAAGTPSSYYNAVAPALDQTFGATTALVANNTGYPDVLFQTERYSSVPNPDNMKWAFPTGDGIYDVKILFNENWNNEINNPRVFDVEIEGVVALDDYRPSGPAGADVNVAKVETYQATVTDGVLNVDFIKGTQNPAVKGFDICFVGPLPSSTPVAAFTAIPNPVACDGVISFDGTSSSHTSGGSFSIVSYEWDFDYDGSTFSVDASGSTSTHTYNASAPSFDVALRVTDDQGTPVSDISVITVLLTSTAPVADAGGPYVINTGDDLVLDGSASSDPDAACSDIIVSYEWELNGDASFDDATGASPTVTAASLATLGLGTGTHTVELRVTDSFGNTNNTTVSLTINQVNVALPICLNVGNQGGLTAFGRTFVSDDPYQAGPSSTFNKLTTPISGTVPGSGEEDLFQSEHFAAPLNYEIPTGNGDFTVELYFAELYIGAPGGGSSLGAGARLMDVDVEGTTETGIDMFATYGSLTAFTKTYAVTVTDGILNIEVDASVDNGKLSGICVTETANFVANAAPTISIAPQADLLDCEGDGEDFTLTADAEDTEQGDMDAVIVWKDDQGTQVGTGPTLALTGLTGSVTYTAEITDATPSTTTATITVNVIANIAPTLTPIVANPSTIISGSSVNLSTTASDIEDDDNTLVVNWTSDIETVSALGSGASISPTLTVVGTHTITASVTDACGETTILTTQVVVSPTVVNSPVITITAPLAGATIGRNVLTTYSATVTDVEDDDATLTAALSWSSVGSTAPNFAGTGGSFDDNIITVGTHVLQATVTDSDGNTSTATVTVTVPAPDVDFTFPSDGGSVVGTDVSIAWTAANMILTSPFDEHFHIYVNPADLNNLNPADRISTATLIGQLTYDLDAADGIVVGVNTIVIVGAEGLHTEYTNPEATDIVNFLVVDPGDPIASFTSLPNPVNCGDPIAFDGSASSHSGPFNIVSYEWDFDYDGSTFTVDATGATSSHSYATIGSYQVALRVTDDQATPETNVLEQTVTVTTATAPVAAAGGAYTINQGDPVTLDGSGSTDPDVACGDAIVSYEWELNNDGLFDDATGVQPLISALDLGTLGLGVGIHPISLRVTDSQGLTNVSNTTLEIVALSTDVFFVINPALSNLNENDPLSLIVEVQANTQMIDAAEVHLTFDPSVVQVQSLTNLATGVLPGSIFPPAFDNTLGTIDFIGTTLSNFPSGTFDLFQIDLVAVGGPTTALDFTFNLPGATTATFAFQNVLTGTTGATINVTENPELVINPSVFNEALTEGASTTNTFAVSTSDANPLPLDLSLVDDAAWLVIDPSNDGYTIDATALTAGTYTANITASGTGYDDGFATVNLVVSPAGVPTAFIAVIPGGAIDESTFGGTDNFQLTNQSTAGIQITSVSIDLSTGLLPDMVFDPTGSGGDATAQCFSPNGGLATAVGLVSPADPCVDPFSQALNGGFEVISMNFTDFDPSEQFTFSVDIDPNSIQGVPGAGGAGAVSGYELVGATVTVSFSDGSTLVSNLFEEGSLGGANALIAPTPTPAPSIAVVGVPTTPATVGNLSQTFTVTGTPGDNVTLLQMDARTYIATGAPPFNVPDVTYYANEALSKTLYSGVIGPGGTVDIPVALVQTAGAVGTPDGGINHFLAVTHTGPYVVNGQTSGTSNPIILRYDQSATLDGNMFLPNLCVGSTVTLKAYDAGTTNLVFDGTGTYYSSGSFLVTGLPVGTFDLYLSTSGYLQKVSTNVTLSSGTNSTGFAVLLAGDVDGDNDVDLNDFTLFSAAFLSAVGDANYNPAADFDCNGQVNLNDFSLLSPQFNSQGDNP